jgi:hypothetical protein
LSRRSVGRGRDRGGSRRRRNRYNQRHRQSATHL